MIKRIAFVTPRYSPTMGGAEALCAAVGRELANKGADVTILTTCAADNRTWENELPAGPFTDGALHGIRFPVDERDLSVWIPLQIRIAEGLQLTVEEQLRWLEESVNSKELYRYIATHGLSYDVLLFAPYLFGTTFFGSLIHPERSVLIPCFHDESFAYLDVMRVMVQSVRGALFNAYPEQLLSERLYGQIPCGVVGMGFSEFSEEAVRDISPFFSDSKPYLLYLGRKETGKNVHLLIDYFIQWKQAAPEYQNVNLVICGGGSFDDLLRPKAKERGDIIDVQHVSETDKVRLLRYAAALVQPSVNESFSIVMMEAWRLGVPVLVHGHSEVTRDHVLQSGGGLYFSDAPDFSAVLSTILFDSALRARLAIAGRQYVSSTFSWNAVIERFYGSLEHILHDGNTRQESCSA